MLVGRMIAVAGSLLVCSVASAQSLDFWGAGSKIIDVYACLEPNCMMEANSPYFPNDVDYQTYAKLTLPPGTWSLRGKLSTYAITWLPDFAGGWGTLECYLGVDPYTGVLPRGQEWYMVTDWASINYGWGTSVGVPLSMAVVASLRAPTTVGMGCRLCGSYTDTLGNSHPYQVGVWGVRLIAEPVGPVVHRLQ